MKNTKNPKEGKIKEKKFENLKKSQKSENLSKNNLFVIIKL